MSRFLAIVFMLQSFVALADSQTEYLQGQLTQARDPRVRAQAALLLASAGDASAASSLCNALADDHLLVRVSAAKALSRLAGPQALQCLHQHRDQPEASVRVAIMQAIADIEATKTTRFYIVLDMSPREVGPEVAQMAESALRERLQVMGAFLGSMDESAPNGWARMRGQNLKGYKLNVILQGLEGGLQMNILCLTYPQRNMLGEVSVNARGAPVSALIAALVPRILEDAAREFEWSP